MLQLLLLGNSYTFYNDLDRLLADALVDGGHPAAATRLAEGGYTFVAHLDQAETAGSPWEEALSDPGEPWTWVILQEQSQIPGFPRTNEDWRDSLAAGGALDDLAELQGADTVLFMTWGRRLGDADNPDLYPDFRTMQDALADGYLTYQSTWSTEARPVWVAPVGWAWEAVYDRVLSEGLVPEDDGTLFSNLYNVDGSHPSPLGSWLAACVFYATLTGESPVGLPAPETLPEKDAATLQALADELVLHTDLGLAYPWGAPSTGTDPTDTASTDTASTDTASTDTGEVPDADDTAAADDDKEPADDPGCGCATGSGSAGAIGLGALAVVAGVRRQRPGRASRRAASASSTSSRP